VSRSRSLPPDALEVLACDRQHINRWLFGLALCDSLPQPGERRLARQTAMPLVGPEPP
jgi:hypothetical protein